MNILNFRITAIKSTQVYKITILIIFCFFCLKLLDLVAYKSVIPSTTTAPKPNITDWNFKVKSIYALVLYTRKNHASILLRYLLPNLTKNGGILHKIVFAVKTNNTESLNYLESILKKNEPYLQQIRFSNSNRYREIYTKLEDDDLIFKIDDDIVFIANGTFERMLEEYIKNKLLFLSANVVNHPLLSHVHARMRAIMPFYEKSQYNWVKYENITEIEETPSKNNNYDAFGTWLNCDQCAAMAHHSFLYHAERNNLDVYDFKIWDFHSSFYTRWSINFVLMRGKYVNKVIDWLPVILDDEVAISHKIPELLKRHAYALGSALVVHFSYQNQYNYMKNTTLLDRYENFSKKYVVQKFENFH